MKKIFNPSQKSPGFSPWDECYCAFSAREEAPDFSPGSFTIPSAIDIYDEGVKNLNLKKLEDFINTNFGDIKINFIKIKKKIVCTKGLLFDFVATQKAFGSPKYNDPCNIILTETLFTTFDEDKKPHIRASIYGFPSVISLSGIVEGPAKPREFYVYKQRYGSLGVWEIKEQELKKKFKGEFIDYGDRRLTEVIKGYIAQAVFFYITREPFCEKKSCRLFNAHWQKDLIYAQIESGKFCKYHTDSLGKIKSLPTEQGRRIDYRD